MSASGPRHYARYGSGWAQSCCCHSSSEGFPWVILRRTITSALRRLLIQLRKNLRTAGPAALRQPWPIGATLRTTAPGVDSGHSVAIRRRSLLRRVSVFQASSNARKKSRAGTWWGILIDGATKDRQGGGACRPGNLSRSAGARHCSNRVHSEIERSGYLPA